MIINFYFRIVRITAKYKKMIENEIKIRVRYGETDQMGHVYYGNYAEYFEVGRVELLRSLGVTYKSLEKSGIMLPVLHMEINFLKPAKYDDLLILETKLVGNPMVKIKFEFKIFSERKELLTTGETTLVFIDMKKNKPTKAPKYLLDKLYRNI